jgi:uncharacterized protein
VVDVEHRGDRARGGFVHALAPPLDREDLFRVSRSVDDVLDNLRDFARELELFAVSDVAMLKRRELLRRLDVVGLRLGEAADALADGAVKRHQ